MRGKVSPLKRPPGQEPAFEPPPLPSPREAPSLKITSREFITKWKLASNLKERSASQSHFNDVCALIGEKTPVEADPDGTWYTFEKGACKIGGDKGWADVWKKGYFAWEYKGKQKNLTAALAQLQKYAIALDNPPLLVVSDMETIVIHTNFNNCVHEEHRITLDDLETPEALQKLKWLFTDSKRLKPEATTETVTKHAAAAFAKVAQRLRDQGFEGRRVAHFMTKLVFCMFAEDIGILPDKVFNHILEAAETQPQKFAGKVKNLFAAMKGGGDFGYVDIPWFNGGLFDDDDALPLDRDGVKLILQAARLDWSQIEPSIFGTLFERGLDPSKRSQIGAHYTDPESIRRIIDPVVKEPLEAEWGKTKREIETLLTTGGPSTPKKLLKDAAAKFERFLRRLCSFRVLDAACGSGNFLYLALVELKNLEHRVRLEGETYGFHRSFNEVGPQNVIGIEINDYAAELARVTIWIGEIQWMIRNGFGAPSDPVLKRLEHIENRDALLNSDGSEAEWPSADCIIGNPPFLGNKKILSELGQSYASRLREVYKGRVPGDADFVTYWFEKARAEIEVGKARRAGLVATNSIRGGANRKVLERVCSTGRIFCAWSDEPWINEGAAVRVSIVCFEAKSAPDSVPYVVAEPEPCYGASVRFNDSTAAEIFPDLTARQDGTVSLNMTAVKPLAENKRICFMGTTKVGPFDISADLARPWLTLPTNPNGRPNADVVRPWVNGMDITRRPSDTWIVDFGCDMTETQAAFYEAPFEYVRRQVKPGREKNNREAYRCSWWIHAESRPGMRSALNSLSRFIATSRVAKHRLFVWLDKVVVPDSAVIAVARDDDVTFGILHSRFHELWSLRQCTWLGAGNDPRYTPTTTFETFPFPPGLTPNIPARQYASDLRAQRIATASKGLVELRDNWLNPPEWVNRVPEVVPGFPDRVVPVNEHAARELKKRTLTNLYNLKPQWLVQAHRKLDEAVAAAYGWDADISDDEALRRLLELNQKRAVAAVARPKRPLQGKAGPRKPYQRSFIFGYKGGKEKTGEGTAVQVATTRSEKSEVSMQIAKPTVEELNAAIARAGKSLNKWAAGYLAKLPTFLEKNPGFYRAFGPYWWLVKKALIDHKNFEFGDEADLEWIEALDYGDESLNLLAAFLYYEDRYSEGALTEQQHIMDGPVDSVEYWLEDPDMEYRVIAWQMEG
jgi:type II restriction/modification system DNA methylase subunit YeeA